MSGNVSLNFKDLDNAGNPAQVRGRNGAMYVTLVSPAGALSDGAGIVSSEGTNRSVTATTASSTLMLANAARKGFYVVNDAAVDVWINFGAAAAATPGGGNIKIAANGGRYESGLFVDSGVVNIIAASATAAITAREF